MEIQASVVLKKPHQRWVFGGIGFQNSEASMTGVMSEEFKNQVVLKCFREISPTYARVFTGFAYWNRADMDRFADYYDQTFRKANTNLYVVPWRMPYRDKHFDMEDYAERVASNLEYLIKERKCNKIRHYCLTNELAIGKDRVTLGYNLPLFKEMQETLYAAFRRHDLNVGMVSLDSSGSEPWHYFDWAVANLADTSECFCHHLYFWDVEPGDKGFYTKLKSTLGLMVQRSFSQEKRFILGEFGFKRHGKASTGCMGLDEATHVSFPAFEGECALQYAEACTAVINTGCYSACAWTFIDYPDPMILEDGDTPEEKARFDAIRFSGRGMHSTYNKNGMIRWCDEEKDYRAYAPYYTMGLMAKYFRKGSRVMIPAFDDEDFRVCAVTNPDGSYSVCVVNYKDSAAQIEFTSEHKSDKPLRQYSYDSKNPPYNDFNDLQTYDALIPVRDNRFTVTVPARGMLVLTTDYQERVPTAVTGVKIENGRVSWDACQDEEHAYYRVFRNGSQIASTVAEYINGAEEGADYRVYSVDKYGNCMK